MTILKPKGLPKRLGAVALACAALLLSGCVTLLPKTKPAQLYRFGYDSALAPAAPTSGPVAVGAAPTPIIFGSLNLPPDSGGDRILTVEGNQASYVAEARWTAPASALLHDAIATGFARAGHGVGLEPRGPTAAFYRLDVSVRKFQTDYTRNRPTVSVELDARLIRLSDRMVVGQKFISADVSVHRNDMEMMADGYNQAVTQVVTGLIAFSESSVAALPIAPQKMAPATKGQKVEGL
ncbi:ABC-type transport auxiliary lipoprotein family protein [Asticcacaulis sp. AC466]|uniref:ABC-type transport auxiliary lipoprotein family protein n=1 Tax=Asticcacaulis sp. AC466 TaxID=1282362 RepID=UPI00138AF1E1|nr:ABC-type transport auxiliary lipoprotein family protein [Asticcacaulis sp. AC466]